MVEIGCRETKNRLSPQRKLHLLQKQQSAQLFENTPHHKLMHPCAEKEGNKVAIFLLTLIKEMGEW